MVNGECSHCIQMEGNLKNTIAESAQPLRQRNERRLEDDPVLLSCRATSLTLSRTDVLALSSEGPTVRSCARTDESG